VRWDKAEYMPRCPNKNCEGCTNTAFKAWRQNHFGWRVHGLRTSYYVISRCYKCNTCLENKNYQSSFMGYNSASNDLLPRGKGALFPAYLTHKSAIDTGVLDLLWPLSCQGIRAQTFSNIIIEHHDKQYFKDFLADEHEFAEEKRKHPSHRNDIFSSFDDPKSTPVRCQVDVIYQIFISHFQNLCNNILKMKLKSALQRCCWFMCRMWRQNTYANTKVWGK
jgi:hypothetical protein